MALALLLPAALSAVTAATLNINAASVVNPINYRYLYGSNSVVWMASSRYANVKSSLQQSSSYFVRGLGGSFSDDYHWNGTGSYDANGVWQPSNTTWTKGFTGALLYPPSKVYDNNTAATSQWRSITNTSTAWIWVSMAAAASIDQVKLTWGSPYAVDYKIQVWSSGTFNWAPHESNTDFWTTLATVTGATGGVDTRSFTATSGTVFRILMTSSSGQGFRLNELELYAGGVKQTLTGAAASPTSGAGAFAANYWGGDFGTYMSFVQSLGPKAVPLITVNVGSGTPEEAAAWVHYANIVKGYGIQYWEIGNEMFGAWETGGPIDADEYAKRYIKFAEAMRAEDPSIKLYGPVCGLDTYSELYDGKRYVERFLMYLSAQGKLGLLDGLSHHEYPDFNNTNPTTSLATTSKWTAWKTYVDGLYTTYCGSATAKELLMSEYNSGSATQAVTMQVPNALWVADWLGRFASAFGTRAKTTMWDIMNGNVSAGGGDHGLFESGQTGNPAPFQPRPDYWALHMMGQHFTVEDEAGNSLVAATSTQTLLPVYANTRSDGRLSLMVINKSPSVTYAGTINLSGFSPMPNASVWTWGDTALAPNYVDNWNWQGSVAVPYADLDLSPTASTISNASASFAFTFAPYSLTILLCDPNGTPTFTPTVTPSPTSTLTRTPTPSASATRSATATRTASPSSTLSVTPSVTLSASPSLTATPSLSPTVQLSATPTPSESPLLTDTGTPTASPQQTATGTPTQSPAQSATPTASPSATPSLSPALTATSTPSDTPLQSPTFTPAVTPTLSPSPAPTAAAGSGAAVNILDLRFMPQPNPRLLLFQLEGSAQSLQLSYYSPAYVRLHQQVWSGAWGPGWHSVSVDQPLADLIGPGQRFAVLKASGAKGDASKKVGRLFVLR